MYTLFLQFSASCFNVLSDWLGFPVWNKKYLVLQWSSETVSRWNTYNLWMRISVLMFGERGLITGDLCELTSVLGERLNPRGTQSGHALQGYFSAGRTYANIYMTMMSLGYGNMWYTMLSFRNTYLPLCFSFFSHFEAWNFLSEEFHSDGHEKATVIFVAAGGVYCQENHQENDHDDANHAAFGHTAAFNWEQRGQSMDDFKLYRKLHVLYWHSPLQHEPNFTLNFSRCQKIHLPGCSAMVKLNDAGVEEPLALTADTSSW